VVYTEVDMNKPIEQPDKISIFMLLKQNGVNFTPVSSSVTTISPLGVGFFWNKEDAEQHRTMEILKMSSTDASILHIFELEVPNTAKK
jgi:hypothetical protein